MFVGAVPRPAVEQITRTVPFSAWREVFVGCSGSFRFDLAVKDVHPSVRVHSNDVSLLSCSLGAAATGTEFPITFTGRLAFIEEALAGQPFKARVAAVEVALEMAKYKGKNVYAQTHFAHYQSRFSDFLAPALARLEVFLEHLDVASFHAGDFRQQARRAAEVGGGVAAFPPTYKNGYERLYRFVEDNTEWDRPPYEVWDPARIEDWLDELDAMGVHYCVLTDHTLERHEPATVYRSNTNKPVYTFADRSASSVRRGSHKSEPFRYVPVDPAALTARSAVEIVAATSGQMNFLKDIYLAKAIAHTSGIANFLVLIDGHLAGGFIYARHKSGGDAIYLLSDFALAPKSRLSKLIAMLATSHTVISRMEIKLMHRITAVYSTAFTDKPVSMKYRGIYDLVGRKPGMLNYASKVRPQTPGQIYVEWFQRFVANARHQGPIEPAEAA
jgi:DNA adenine methylase-like protein/GNAT domain-containint protein